jgi:mRNA interferase MazF
MRRGELWWAALPSSVGSGPGYRRPVLVVQSNPFNDSRISTAIVAVVTSNLALGEAPGNVRVGRSESGLQKASVINVSQLITIDRSILRQKIRAVPAAVLNKVDEGLRLVLGL